MGRPVASRSTLIAGAIKHVREVLFRETDDALKEHLHKNDNVRIIGNEFVRLKKEGEEVPEDLKKTLQLAVNACPYVVDMIKEKTGMNVYCRGIHAMVDCPNCRGMGCFHADHDSDECGYCDATGKVTKNRHTRWLKKHKGKK